MDNLFDLKSKVVVITGAGGVLCGCMAQEIAKLGAKVALLNRSVDNANATAAKINEAGGEAFVVACDVLKEEDVKRAFDEVMQKWGRVDALVNGAGGNNKLATTSEEQSFFDLSIDAVKSVFGVNFIGTFLPCQIFGKQMAAQGSGVIINISSMAAMKPLTKIPAYASAKAAVDNFTQWLSVHMCQNYSKEIRVNAIAPGFFLTKQNRFLLTDPETGDYTARGKSIIDHTPMARFGEAQELVGTLVWLLSDASKFVTGIVVPVDGGYSSFGGI